MRRTLGCTIASIAATCIGCATTQEDASDAGGGQDASLPLDGAERPLRYLAINAGNASPQFGCWEYKLCRPGDVASLREYLAGWRPDVVMLSEVLQADQLMGTVAAGPILPEGYAGMCGESLDRDTGEPAAFDAQNASHEHECVAWRADRLTFVPGSAHSVRGRNDAYGRANCNYDFTGFAVRLQTGRGVEITAVAVHPDSTDAACRVDEIARIWSELAPGGFVVIGGDWNTEDAGELQRPSRFRVDYSHGHHGDLAVHPDEFTASYALGAYTRSLDHAFSSFGALCTTCATGLGPLPFGSAIGGHDGHPRADGGEGFDHRQILVDLVMPDPSAR